METAMTASNANDDLKAKMREALEKKNAHLHPDDSAAGKSSAHGPEVASGAKPKVHRRKAGGGGS